MSDPKRSGLLTAERRDDDSETSLRPLSLADFTGQAGGGNAATTQLIKLRLKELAK
ncbi:hypothetical protein [Bosea sp. TAF32]|uniref:hypothetical protein n=1 Tax=Bosea sp. TAF32 TaxID=3237482 RepID=UPI003F92D79C